jgi:ACS family tartrate transporter-like MFS transporter
VEYLSPSLRSFDEVANDYKSSHHGCALRWKLPMRHDCDEVRGQQINLANEDKPHDADQSRIIGRKVLWRLGVPTIILMLLSSLDRVNISFAALQMNGELGFSPSQYGFGAGILFLGFLAGQYPSVLLMQRIGMRRWVSLCCIAWAVCAAAVAFVRSPLQFYVLRVLLGFAEGGLAPGIVVYLSQFAGERARATTFALPMLAIPLSIVIGSPISGWLMSRGAPFGVSGWRWMLIAEALPAAVLGAFALFYFPDRPQQASWLNEQERDWVQRQTAGRGGTARGNDWRILRTPLVWACALLWFALLSGSYGIIFWLPQMIKQLSGLSPLQIGCVNALPWIGAMLGMYFNSRHSDQSGERFFHVAVPAVVAAIALLLAWGFGPGTAGLMALFVAGLGLGAAQGAFWAVPTAAFTPATFAVGAVAINIAGSSGGLVMPHLIGLVREGSGSFSAPTLLLAGMLLCAAVLVAAIRRLFFHTPIRANPR